MLLMCYWKLELSVIHEPVEMLMLVYENMAEKEEVSDEEEGAEPWDTPVVTVEGSE